MTAEIVKATAAPSGALSLGQMTPRDAWLFAETLAESPLLPDAYRKQPASVLWAIEYGRALNLDVVTTITTIHVIKGKPTQSADLMLSRARAAGHRVRIKSERTQCVVRIQRFDDPDDETVVEWTLDDAVTAKLCELRDGRPYSRSSKGEPQAWEKFPRAMLRARAVAEAVRTACPEVLHGAIYTPEEVGAYVDQDGNPIDAPVTPLRVVQAEPAPQQRDRDQAVVAAAEIGMAAADAESLDAWRELWSRAGSAGLLDVPIVDPDGDQQVQLREYLTRRGADLKQPTVVEAELVEDDDRTKAISELREAALEAGLAATIEGDFAQSYGMPIADAPIDKLAEMTGMLRGAA